MKHKFVIFFFTLSLAFSEFARWIAGPENENTEYRVTFLGHQCDYC